MGGRKMLCALLLAGFSPLIAGSQGGTNQIDERLLAAHNRERAQLGLEPLDWDPELAVQAKAWSRELATRDVLQHAPQQGGERQGENLWAGSVGHYTPEDMIESWAEEKAVFRPGAFPAVSRTGNWSDVGHYTQIVWRDTHRVGCGVARGQESDYLVCRYSSAGNVAGQRVY